MDHYSAPPVTYPLGRSRFLGSLLLLAWAVTALLTSAWWRLSAAADQGPWLGVAALMVAGILMFRGWWRSPVGLLSWSGEHWHWESPVYQDAGAVRAPLVVLDLQRAMLLRLDNRAGVSWWLWAERVAEPPRWLDLRRAVHALPPAEYSVDGQANVLPP